MNARWLCLPLVLLAPAVALAQGATLVRDINTSQPADAGSDPRYGFQLGGTCHFFADGPQVGFELYRTDGTAAGTALVEDRFPGTLGWVPMALDDGRVFPGATRAYFIHLDSPYLELWSTDGTAGGFRRAMRKLRVGQSDWHGITLGDLFVFSFDDGALGREVWISDGTEAGTRNLVNRNLSGPGVRGRFVARDGWVYYVSIDDATGTQLHRTDGTRNRRVVEDLFPGAASSDMVLLGATADHVYFAADDGVHGRELWRTDGTTAGTIVLDVAPGAAGIGPEGVAVPLGNALVFSATDVPHGREPWVTDGTVAGTGLLLDIESGAAGSGPSGFAACNGRLLFHASTAATGREPWVTDGTPAGTVMLADVLAGATGSITFAGQVWTTTDRLASTTCFGSGAGLEVLVTDGTPGNTLFIDFAAGGATSGSAPIGALSPTEILLRGSTRSLTNVEPWKTDGSLAGTVLITELRGSGVGVTDSSIDLAEPPRIATSPRGAWFAADDGQGSGSGRHALWSSDLTGAGTLAVGIQSMDARGPGTLFGSEVVYGGDAAGSGLEPWVTDGGGTTSRLIADLRPGPAASTAREFLAFRGGVWFFADDGSTGLEPWVTDTTGAGTIRLGDLMPGTTTSVGNFREARVGDFAFFYAATPGEGLEPWVTDGTVANTRRVQDVLPGPSHSIVAAGAFVEWRGRCWFSAAAAPTGGIFVSDGTDSGTQRAPGDSGYRVRQLVATEECVYALDDRGILVALDGTIAGTGVVADVRMQGYGAAFDLAAGSGGVYFTAEQPQQRRKLFFAGRSGAVEVGDFDQRIEVFAVGSRHVWFAVEQNQRFQVWRSDGTPGGTTQRFGRVWEDGAILGAAAGQLLFAADDDLKGMEPWSAPVGACVESFGFGCGEGIRAPSFHMSDPVLGDSVRLSLRASRPSAPGLMVLGTPGDGVALPNGCTMYIDDADVLTLLATDAQGDWQVTVPLLNDPALRGLRFAVMGAVAGAGGFDSTHTAVGVFGD